MFFKRSYLLLLCLSLFSSFIFFLYLNTSCGRVVDESDGILKWTYVCQQIYWSSPAIGDDGTIYIGSAQEIDSIGPDYIYAINSNGTLKWRYETGVDMPIKGAPAIGSDGTIYCVVFDVAEETTHLYALSSSGTLKWTYNNLCPSSSVAAWGEWTVAISADDVIYAPTRGNGLLAIDSRGGLLWHYTGDDPLSRGNFTSPIISPGGTIYTVSGGLHSINPDGTLKWLFTDDLDANYEYSSAALASSGTIYFGRASDDGGAWLYAVNPNGSLAWKFNTGGLAVFASPAVDSDGTIYVGTTAKGPLARAGQSGIFYAINPSGTEKWSYDTSPDHLADFPGAQKDIYSSAAIALDGTIFFSSESRYIYAFNPDGTIKNKFDLWELTGISGVGVVVYSSPAIASDGTLYVGDYYHRIDTASSTAEGAVYAIQTAAAGLQNGSPWPKFHGNNKNTGRLE